RCVRPRRAGDHVLQKFLVSRRIDDRVTAARCSKRNLSRIDRNILLLLLDKRIQQKREFKLHPFSRTGLLYLLNLSFGQRNGGMQNSPDERGLVMVYMPNKHN